MNQQSNASLVSAEPDPNLSPADKETLFLKSEEEDNILSLQPWQVWAKQHHLLRVFQALWGAISEKEAFGELDDDRPQIDILAPTATLSAFVRRQRLGLRLTPRNALNDLEKKLSQISNQQLAKFVKVLGIHLLNQPIILMSKSFRTPLQAWFDEKELNKILYGWPCEPKEPAASFSEEAWRDHIQLLGHWGADKILGHCLVWIMRKKEVMGDSLGEGLTLNPSLIPTAAESAWLTSRYFYNFLRWFG